MKIALIIFIILFLIALYVIYNLLRKNEAQERILLGYNIYLNKISEVIEFSNEKLKQIDAKGSFESDDEVGFFFKQIKSIQDILNEFIIK